MLRGEYRNVVFTFVKRILAFPAFLWPRHTVIHQRGRTGQHHHKNQIHFRHRFVCVRTLYGHWTPLSTT